jgi:hypothetical protein
MNTTVKPMAALAYVRAAFLLASEQLSANSFQLNES